MPSECNKNICKRCMQVRQSSWLWAWSLKDPTQRTQQLELWKPTRKTSITMPVLSMTRPRLEEPVNCSEEAPSSIKASKESRAFKRGGSEKKTSQHLLSLSRKICLVLDWQGHIWGAGSRHPTWIWWRVTLMEEVWSMNRAVWHSLSVNISSQFWRIDQCRRLKSRRNNSRLSMLKQERRWRYKWRSFC